MQPMSECGVVLLVFRGANYLFPFFIYGCSCIWCKLLTKILCSLNVSCDGEGSVLEIILCTNNGTESCCQLVTPGL